MQNRTGFEPDTLLPIPGNPWAMALPVLLGILFLGMLWLARNLPREAEDAVFSQSFSTTSSFHMTLLGLGGCMLVLSGLLELLLALLFRKDGAALPIWLAGDSLFSGSASFLLGMLGLAAALALFPVLRTCRRRPRLQAAACPPQQLLLAMPVFLVIRLVFFYRAASIQPALSVYCVELLALTFLTLSFFRLSGFGFSAGRPRRQAVWTGLCISFCLTALADLPGLAAACLYLGGALTLGAFLQISAQTCP